MVPAHRPWPKSAQGTYWNREGSCNPHHCSFQKEGANCEDQASGTARSGTLSSPHPHPQARVVGAGQVEAGSRPPEVPSAGLELLQGHRGALLSLKCLGVQGVPGVNARSPLRLCYCHVHTPIPQGGTVGLQGTIKSHVKHRFWCMESH